jgi:hypothetical protein
MKKMHNLPKPPEPKVKSCNHFPSSAHPNHSPQLHFPISFGEKSNVSSNVCESTSKAEVSFIHQRTPFAKTPFSQLEEFLRHSHMALNDPKFHKVLVYNSAKDSLSISVFTAEKGLYFDQIIPTDDLAEDDDLRLGVIFKERTLSGLKMVHLGSHTLRQKFLDLITHPAPSIPTNCFPLPHPKAKFVPLQDRLAYRLARMSSKSNLQHPLLIQPPVGYSCSFTLARTCRLKLVEIYTKSKLRDIFLHTSSGAMPQSPFGKFTVKIDEIDFYLDVFLPSMSLLMCTENKDEILYGTKALLTFSANDLPHDNKASLVFRNPARIPESVVSSKSTRFRLAKMEEKYKHFFEASKSSHISDGHRQHAMFLKQMVFESLWFQQLDEYKAAPLILTQAGHHTRDFEHMLCVVKQ